MTDREQMIKRLARSIAKQMRRERARYGAHVAEKLLRDGVEVIENLRRSV
jgi:molecular chaperone GrpE (heat shock protein)